jgi:hypothetical protein
LDQSHARAALRKRCELGRRSARNLWRAATTRLLARTCAATRWSSRQRWRTAVSRACAGALPRRLHAGLLSDVTEFERWIEASGRRLVSEPPPSCAGRGVRRPSADGAGLWAAARCATRGPTNVFCGAQLDCSTGLAIAPAQSSCTTSSRVPCSTSGRTVVGNDGPREHNCLIRGVRDRSLGFNGLNADFADCSGSRRDS